jgi:adenylate cyclase
MGSEAKLDKRCGNMADLLVQGPNPNQQWRRALPAGQAIVIGRDAGDWSVPWEPWLSRRHAELTWREAGFLTVQRLPTARNPIFFAGQESNRCDVPAGSHFVIGATRFLIENDETAATVSEPAPVEERTVSVPELERLPYQNAAHQLDVLRKLPELITTTMTEADLCERVANLLLSGIPQAEAVALVAAAEGDSVHIVTQKLRGTVGFSVSRRLVLEAVQRRKQVVLHVWSGNHADANFTAAGNFDWAFCTPVRGDLNRGWGIYAAGKFAGERAEGFLGPIETSALRDDLKFADLAAGILTSLCQIRRREASGDTAK